MSSEFVLSNFVIFSKCSALLNNVLVMTDDDLGI